MNKRYIQDFEKNGFIVIPQMLPADRIDLMHQIARQQLDDLIEPYELESALGYPGAPSPESPEGKTTIRRLKQAYARDTVWQQWAQDPALLNHVTSILGSQDIALTQAHHNCIMTKTPKLSSRTGWHQDVRYWSFESPALVTAWLSLTDEYLENGCMQVIPGSHRMPLASDQFDSLIFFRDDLEKNKAMIQNAETLTLKRGDLLLFDARLLHCAGNNASDDFKMSLVFTYKRTDNLAIENTRSSASEEINMASYIKSSE